MQDKTDERAPRIGKLQALADQHETRGRPRSRRLDPEVRELIDGYARLMRRTEPSYSPGRGVTAKMRKLRRELKARHVPRRLWEPYLVWIFDVFPRITGGRMSYPPPATVASEGFVDRYVAEEMGVRKLDGPKAVRMLQGAGVTGVDLPTVVSMAVRARASGAVPKTLPEEYKSPVEWLLARFDRIGYRDEEEA